jgi:ABC-type siderophore export system fused ATPase/permease subunit
MNFSGSFLVDGNDRKRERLAMLLQLIEDYDIVLLNEVVCSHLFRAHAGTRAASA